MTPLRLEIEGFTCFRSPTVVDLSELDVDLFAIAGPTGAGKSTLLDAMTYGLYGQTARLGSRGLDVLLSPGTSEMTVQLSFKTAAGVFRVTRFAWQRTSRVERQTRIEQLDADGRWRQLPASEKLSEANEKLVDIVGLDYDGFTRAVLLPQGAFDEFLRGDAGKRRRLLTVLLGLDRVEQMQKLAGAYSRDAERTVTSLSTRLNEDYRGATAERRRELSDRKVAATQELAAANEQLVRLGADLATCEELKGLDGELREIEAERTALAAEAAAMEEAARRLEQAKRARVVAPLIDAVETLTKRLRATGSDLDMLGRQFAAAEEQRARFASAATAARERLATRGPAIAEHLELLASVAPLAARLVRAGGSLDLAELPGAAEHFDDGRWEQIEGLRQRLPALERLCSALAAATRSLVEGREAAAALEREIADTDTLLAELKQRGLRARKTYNACREGLERLRTEHRVAAVREGLKLGDPCPVCGEPIRKFAPLAGGDLEEAQLREREADRELKVLLDEHSKVQGLLTGAHKRLEDRRSDLGRRGEEVARLEADLATARAPFAASGFSGDDLAAAVAEERSGLLAALAATVLRVTGREEPAQLRRRLQDEQSVLGSAVQAAEASLAEATRSSEGLRARRAMLGERRDELIADRVGAMAALDSGLAESGFTDAEAARSALLPALDLDEIERRLTTFASRREAVERRGTDLTARLAGRRYDSEAHAALARQQRELRDAADRLQRRIGSLTADLERLEQMLERAKALRAELKGAQANFDTYRQLSLDLRGDRFQEFLMTRVQSDLARRASHIVRTVTDGRYDLRLEAGEYQVLDAWSDGGPRSARTLSGGETFIASLALALALSDTVAGSHALGALFLDEGFGGLDRETLDAVARVLEALSHEGRMVGIITHVQELSERMPARLLVHKGPDGSAVSWDA